MVHGEVRLQKVRLTQRGQAVLVDAGIRQANGRGRLIHLGHKPEQCDGVAPEIVGSGQVANVVSDVYALGCLLWQLLAGRPVFPHGDPLAKLAAHRTCDVPDIREWAPDVPSEMAEILKRMTASDPAGRPQSFEDVQQGWGRRRGGDCRLLSRSLKSINPRVSGRFGASRSVRWPLVAALLLVVSGAAFSLADRGAVAGLLNIASDWVSPLLRQANQPQGSEPPSAEVTAVPGQPQHSPHPIVGAAPKPAVAVSGLRPLPIPTADGLLELESGQVYAAARVTTDVTLIVRCSGDAPAHIAVGQHGLRLEAPSVAITNVNFYVDPGEMPAAARRSSSTRGADVSKTAASLLLVTSDSLSISACRFEDARRRDPRLPSVIGVAWKPAANRSESDHEVWVEDCLFHGVHMAAYVSRVPRRFQLTNCLVVSGDLVFSLPGVNGSDAQIVCQQLTVRDTMAVIGLRHGNTRSADPPMTVLATQSVIDLAPDGALVWIPESLSVAADRPLLAVTGDAVLVSPHVAELRVGQGRGARTGPAGMVSVEGLAASAFQFEGAADADPQHARLKTFQPPPRVSDGDHTRRAPGIDVETLAQALGLPFGRP